MRFTLIQPRRPDLSGEPYAPHALTLSRSHAWTLFMGGGGSAPPQRNLYDETSGELKAKLDLQPAMLAAETQYQPQYNSLDLSNLQALLEGSKATTRDVPTTKYEAVPPVYRYDPQGRRFLVQPGYSRPVASTVTYDVPAQRGLLDMYQNDFLPANERITSQSRAADINDVATLGPQATAAFRAANPEQAALMASLNKEAQSELDAGANLDPSLSREVSQSVRAGQAARGMGMGVDDLANETFFQGLQAEQLRRARQAFATGVVGLDQSQSMDPFMSILGRPSVAMGQANNFTGQAQGIARSSGPQLFGSSVNANDVYNSNFNAANATNISNANNSAAVNSAAIGGGIAVTLAAAL